MFLSEPAASRLPCVVSELALAERRLGGCLCVCTHPRPPPTPRPSRAHGVRLLAFFFGVYTGDGVDVRCVAGEFPANAECSAGSPGTSAGTSQACGQRPLVERPEFGQPSGGGYFLVAIGEGLVAAPWEPGAGPGCVSRAVLGPGWRAVACPSVDVPHRPSQAGLALGASAPRGEGAEPLPGRAAFCLPLCLPGLA